jgi:hypothetical protein
MTELEGLLVVCVVLLVVMSGVLIIRKELDRSREVEAIIDASLCELAKVRRAIDMVVAFEKERQEKEGALNDGTETVSVSGSGS